MRNSISINAIVWHQHLICNTLSFSQLHERFPGLTISKDKISLHHLLLRVNNLGSAPKPDKQTQHRVGMSRWLLRVQKTNDVTPTGLHVSNILSNTDLLWMLLAQDWIKKTCVVYIEIEMPLDNMSTQKTNLPGGDVYGIGFSTGYYQLVVWLLVGSLFTNHNVHGFCQWLPVEWEDCNLVLRRTGTSKRTSKNWAARTLETKSVCVGRKETEDMIIDNLSSDPVPPISEAS